MWDRAQQHEDTMDLWVVSLSLHMIPSAATNVPPPLLFFVHGLGDSPKSASRVLMGAAATIRAVLTNARTAAQSNWLRLNTIVAAVGEIVYCLLVE